MNGDDVCAVVYADAAASAADELVRAVEAQSCAPHLVRDVTSGPGSHDDRGRRESPLAAAVRIGRSHGTRWIWLLDGRAVPEPGALEALLAANDRVTEPAPVLLASKVVNGDGRLHPAATPRHEIFEKAHSVDAAERHLVQLRFAAHGSVLVAASVADRFAAPRSDLPSGIDMHEWSARVLRRWEDTGYLVPDSVAVRTAPPVAPTWRDWWGRVRLLGSDAWGPTEKLWEVFLLGGAIGEAIRPAAAVRGGRASGPQASDRPAARGG